MSLVSVQSLTCEQATKLLFKDASFGIQEGDKLAVIGPNGSGKSTLLELIAGSIDATSSTIVTRNGLQISYLKQQLEFEPSHTIQDHLFQSKTPAALAYQEYQECLSRYQVSVNDDTEEAFNLASAKMDQLDAWAYESRVTSILSELDIDDLSQKMSDLSGGMLKKIALAQFFFDSADLLILDEPTNHLDVQTIEWLEGMLKQSQSAILMVTHDRYFLDKVCTKVIEIDQQHLFLYEGNYHAYLDQRQQRYAEQEKHESRIQSVLRVELAWLKRGPKARSTKQKARKDRIYSLLSRDSIDSQQSVSFDVADRRLGKKICELKEVSKSFSNQNVISSFSYRFNQGDRIGIVGPNGSGKTTLLKLIMEQISPDSGEVDCGVNTTFAYFDQHSEHFDLDQTILEHVNEIGSQIKRHDDTYVSAPKLLEQFLFPSSMLNTPIYKLSGGERRRLHLVCLLLENPNFLLFDEPTNDLDIQTLSVLETFLNEFKGCVLVISHDRYFMDRVVNQLFVFKPGGVIVPITGSYSDYREILREIELSKSKPSKLSSSVSDRDERHAHQKALKLIEKKIAKLEKEQESLSYRLSELSPTDSTYVTVCSDLKSLSSNLDSAMEEWESLLTNE